MDEKLRKAFAKIGLEFEALSIYPMSWEIYETDKIPTMGTDFKSLCYSPSFIETLSLEETVAVILHEIFHCVLLHPMAVDRDIGKDKNEFVWTLALEQVTNAEVKHLIGKSQYKLPGKEIDPLSIVSGELEAKKGYVYSHCLDGKNELEVYEILMKKYKKGCESYTEQLLLANDVIAKKMSAEEKQMAVEKAVAIIKKMLKRGDVSKNLERLLTRLTTPQIPWQRVVRQFVSQIIDGHEEMSFTKPNIRRQTVDDVIMLATQQSKVDEPVIVFDTSGSISDKDIRQFASEMQTLLNDVVESVVIITTDAEVKERVKVSSIKDIMEKVKFLGRGGTDFRPLFNEIRKCEFMVFFTDGEALYPDQSPKYPVLWVLTGDHKKPPFGKIAYVYNE